MFNRGIYAVLVRGYNIVAFCENADGKFQSLVSHTFNRQVQFKIASSNKTFCADTNTISK